MRFLLALLFVLASASSAAAQTVTLAWDPNPVDDHVTMYTVHWGTVRGVYTDQRSVDGQTTEITISLPDRAAVRHYFAVSASDGIDESAMSEVVADFLPPGQPRWIQALARLASPIRAATGPRTLGGFRAFVLRRVHVRSSAHRAHAGSTAQ